MSHTNVSPSIKHQLWGRAAGRCQYDDCPRTLFHDDVTKINLNGAYVAHIVADSPGGPRGDPVLSELLKDDITNLMLLCDVHHRLIDREGLLTHTVDRLREMKAGHELRIEIASQITPQKQSHVVLYGANIGHQAAQVSYEAAARAMFPARYPAEQRAIELGLTNSAAVDHDDHFWRTEENQLRRQFAAQVAQRLASGDLRHLSVFGLAPQPLLMLLGSLLSDIPAAEVYQLHREPPGWAWPATGADPGGLSAIEPSASGTEVALILSVSAGVSASRVHAVLGEGVSIWEITSGKNDNDFMRFSSQLSQFRTMARELLDRIKQAHPHANRLHVFPAAPVSCCVEFGRVLMPKAHLPLRIYDENRRLGGFVRALDIGSSELRQEQS